MCCDPRAVAENIAKAELAVARSDHLVSKPYRGIGRSYRQQPDSDEGDRDPYGDDSDESAEEVADDSICGNERTRKLARLDPLAMMEQMEQEEELAASKKPKSKLASLRRCAD